jgi:hypothetical protein
LDGGLLVGADDEVASAERFAIETPPVIEVEHPAGLQREVRIAGEGPTAVLPGTDGVGREPPPDGGVRDRGDDTLLDGGSGEIRGVPAGQRHAVGGGQLARQCFDRHDHLRGERPGAARFVVALGARPGVARGTACATWRRSGGECPAGRRSRRWPSPRRPAARSWLVSRRGTPKYSAGRSLGADRARLWLVRCGKGWFSAWLAPSSGGKHDTDP